MGTGAAVTGTDDDGWIPLPDTEPLDRWHAPDLAFVDDIAHPTRGPLLRRFREPSAVAEIAERMGVPVTRLYHHVNQLVERGLIRPVATRQVGARTETRYQVVARTFDIDPVFFESAEGRQLATALGSLFEVAKGEFQQAVEEGFRPHDDRDSVLSLGELVLSPARQAELMARLQAVIEEFGSDADETDDAASRYLLFISAFPAAD